MIRITKSQLKQIIREELDGALSEDESSDQRVIQLVERATVSFTEIFNPEELDLIADRHNRDMFIHYLFENIQLQLDNTVEELDEALSDEEMRAHIERDLGLPPGSIKSGEELKQAEKERKEKSASMPRDKAAPAPRTKKPYGGGSKYRPWGRST